MHAVCGPWRRRGVLGDPASGGSAWPLRAALHPRPATSRPFGPGRGEDGDCLRRPLGRRCLSAFPKRGPFDGRPGHVSSGPGREGRQARSHSRPGWQPRDPKRTSPPGTPAGVGRAPRPRERVSRASRPRGRGPAGPKPFQTGVATPGPEAHLPPRNPGRGGTRAPAAGTGVAGVPPAWERAGRPEAIPDRGGNPGTRSAPPPPEPRQGWDEVLLPRVPRMPRRTDCYFCICNYRTTFYNHNTHERPDEGSKRCSLTSS
jgi:hypothetical protein